MSQPTRPPSPAILAAIAVGALLLGLLVFRSTRASGDVREWTPADHDQPAGAQAAPNRRQGAKQPGKTPDASSLVELAWSKNCASCHGPVGRGDGSMGPMVRAPDLTRDEWQGKVSDDEIAQVIKNGRNKMPKFDLPPDVVDGLVKRIRANRAKN
jgi:cytochrome c oxidase cbb3-type subunit 3